VEEVRWRSAISGFSIDDQGFWVTILKQICKGGEGNPDAQKGVLW